MHPGLSLSLYEGSGRRNKNYEYHSFQETEQNIYFVSGLTPCQNPIEAPEDMICSSITRSNICAKGRYDKYTSFSVNYNKNRTEVKQKEKLHLLTSRIIKPLTSSFMLPKWKFIPDISQIMFSLLIITPFGSPVVPLVYIIVHISLFFFSGSSNSLPMPCKTIWHVLNQLC